MPLFEYRCLKCHRHTDKIEKYSGPQLEKCPHCGGKVERMISAPAIQFKGSGWYVNDYGRGKTSGGDGAKSARAKTEKTASSPESGSKPASPAKKGEKPVTASKEK